MPRHRRMRHSTDKCIHSNYALHSRAECNIRFVALWLLTPFINCIFVERCNPISYRLMRSGKVEGKDVVKSSSLGSLTCFASSKTSPSVRLVEVSSDCRSSLLSTLATRFFFKEGYGVPCWLGLPGHGGVVCTAHVLTWIFLPLFLGSAMGLNGDEMGWVASCSEGPPLSVSTVLDPSETPLLVESRNWPLIYHCY